MYATTFNSSFGIESIEIQGKTAIIIDDNSRSSGNFLASLGKCTVICPHDYPYIFLKRIASKDIKILRKTDKGNNGEKAVERLNKAKILGLNINPYDLPSSYEQACDTLKLMNNEKFKEDILRLLNIHIKCAELKDYVPYALVGSDGLFMHISMSINVTLYDFEVNKIIKAYYTDNYAIMVYSKFTIVGIISAKGMLKYLKYDADAYDELYKYLDYCIKDIMISAEDIENIKEEHEKLIIELKNGKSITVGYKEISEGY